jgi:putative protein kinase ArgK-like GTPase of G3E family
MRRQADRFRQREAKSVMSNPRSAFSDDSIAVWELWNMNTEPFNQSIPNCGSPDSTSTFITGGPGVGKTTIVNSIL